jgi:hypothetical protein
MAALARARFIVAVIPFDRWQHTLGWHGQVSDAGLAIAERFARHVDWAGRWLPFETKCLPRAMALSWILRRKKIAHAVIFAVRPTERRGSDDDLHAWVEVGRRRILGDLPGPWVETLRLEGRNGR